MQKCSAHPEIYSLLPSSGAPGLNSVFEILGWVPSQPMKNSFNAGASTSSAGPWS